MQYEYFRNPPIGAIIKELGFEALLTIIAGSSSKSLLRYVVDIISSLNVFKLRYILKFRVTSLVISAGTRQSSLKFFFKSVSKSKYSSGV